MTIASEIQRIQTNIANTYDALETAGATMPATENSDNLASTVATIPTGGGDTVTATNATGSAITAGDKVWLQKENGSWKIKSFYSDAENFNKIGYPTITNKVVSGFSGSNYLQLKSYPTNVSNFEIGIKFTTSSITGWQTILGPKTTGGSTPQIDISSSGVLRFYLPNATSNEYSVSPNTTYWLKCIWTGTDNILEVSTDGVNYTTISTFPLTTFSWPEPCDIGTDRSYDPFGGSVDLSETYINVNGYRFWSPYFENITEEFLTGVALENIESNATGDIETILP